MKHLSLLVIAMIIAIVSNAQLPAAITGPAMTCVGSSTPYTDATSGGTWSTSTTGVATIGMATGVLTGVAAGVVTITYTIPTGSATKIVTVNPNPAPITGSSTVCVGGYVTLADASAGGAWSSANVVIATMSAFGTVYGVSSGSVMITYAFLATGCVATHPMTVSAAPAAYMVIGGGSYCAGGSGVSGGLDGSDIGISYQLYNGASAVGAPIPGTGGALSFGSLTTPGVYSVVAAGLCSSTMPGYDTVNVLSLPTVTASASSVSCDGSYALTAGGASTYTWTPGSGLSCSGCGTPTANPSASTAYTVTGTDGSGCTNTASVSVDGNRISGTVSPTVSGTIKVWLVQFNASDSSIIATDSTTTCSSGGSQYYYFADPPTGDYLVKAYLTGGTPGSSGYIPTYGTSFSHWYDGTSITHASATDNMNVTMLYGTVPSGPGFIGGFVASGAGKGTSGTVPAVGMLIYLMNTSGNVLTYTYTNASGNYSFTGLGYGNYVVYPEEYQYRTTPSATINLSGTSETAASINFKEHTTSHKITPYDFTGVKPLTGQNGIVVYPNPASGVLNIQWNGQAAGNATVVLTDVAGREVSRSVIDINAASGEARVSLDGVNNGVYMITVKGENVYYSGKVVVE